MTNASPVMLQSTCARDAPSARSIANSRLRCATVIEKALKMMNAPTSTAMPPKASRTGRRNCADRVAQSLRLVGRRLGAGLDLRVRGQRRPEAASRGPRPRRPRPPSTSISERRPSIPNQRCASASVVWIRSDPPSDDWAANLNTPETVASCPPPSGDHGDRRARLELLVLGELLDDGHLARLLRRVALDVLRRRDVVGRVREEERRRAAGLAPPCRPRPPRPCRPRSRTSRRRRPPRRPASTMSCGRPSVAPVSWPENLASRVTVTSVPL